MKYFKPISISLSPNVEKDDVKLALNLIIRPWLWRKGKGITELEESFKGYVRVNNAISFNSGRSALYAILKSLDLSKGSKVLLQAFTCNAVPNPILWSELEPVYVDCDTIDFNIDIEDLKKKILENPDVKVLIVQHTFGLPVDMKEIGSIVRQNNLILIEDCAHSLGAEYANKKVGTFGQAAFFSFSRDKVISSVYGGVAVTNDSTLAEKIRQFQTDFKVPGRFWTFQQILHPILLNFIILPIYKFLDLGKIFLVLSQWFHILSKAVSKKEKRGQKPDYFPKALPNALAIMALNQLGKIEKFNTHRIQTANFYYNNLNNIKFKLPPNFPDRKNIFLRFTIKHPKAHKIIYDAWNTQNILIGDWYTTCIAPFDTKLSEMKYTAGSCPNAESLAKTTLNLPTHINIKQKELDRIINFLKKYNGN